MLHCIRNHTPTSKKENRDTSEIPPPKICLEAAKRRPIAAAVTDDQPIIAIVLQSPPIRKEKMTVTQATKATNFQTSPIM